MTWRTSEWAGSERLSEVQVDAQWLRRRLWLVYERKLYGTGNSCLSIVHIVGFVIVISQRV